MLIKKAYTMEELMLYLEALEMLDMVYKIDKFPRYQDTDGETLHHVWIIQYEQGEPPEDISGINFED